MSVRSFKVSVPSLVTFGKNDPVAIKYLPNEMLKKIAPEKKVQKLMKNNFTVNKAVLSFITDADFISKKNIEKTALSVIKQYKKKYEDNKEEGLDTQDAKDEATNDNALLVNRVQNAIVSEVKDQIEETYYGEYYKWLPSDADTPDPLHQLKYGKRYRVGKGEMPGDRDGCRCGMLILTEDTKLKL